MKNFFLLFTVLFSINSFAAKDKLTCDILKMSEDIDYVEPLFQKTEMLEVYSYIRIVADKNFETFRTLTDDLPQTFKKGDNVILIINDPNQNVTISLKRVKHQTIKKSEEQEIEYDFKIGTFSKDEAILIIDQFIHTCKKN